ncbi:hypothetical protein B7494_g8 [Chlorociboria aeruginascens]|nr:hypothetical protein B7494_g8 [Chlorociboria aeruginascens]
MDPGRKAMISGRRSPARDITSPRRDRNTRISKPQRQIGSSGGADSRASRHNQNQEDEQTRKWVSQEDNFVLKQAKKKADIRVREGRAKPVDWLAVILRVIDPDRDLLDDDEEAVQTDVVDPEGVFEGLNDAQFGELEADIDSYLALETNKKNKDYWQTMQIICNDRRQKLKPMGHEGRAVSSVAADVDKLLGPKTYEQLEALEDQIRIKLRSNEPIDVDYWEQLLRSLLIWKAKAKLKKVYQSVLDSRMETLREQQQEDAEGVRQKLQEMLSGPALVTEEGSDDAVNYVTTSRLARKQPNFQYSPKYDPEPLLKLRNEDKSSDMVDESVFLQKVVAERRRVLKLGYIPLRQTIAERGILSSASKPINTTNNNAPPGTHRFSAMVNEDFSQATKALYEREVARGVNENEEIFTGEESVTTLSKPQWAEKYRPRKPRYFNRVQMGYEWNKYNQTHYDHDNPPPKVVQGYKFNIFYPDLIDKAKAPTFRIIREHGRKKGESFAPAGEEDTCLIRFIAGPPYEDIAFRIVDKEWDYSAKRDRGFRSSFDKNLNNTHVHQEKYPALGIRNDSMHRNLLARNQLVSTFDSLPRTYTDQNFVIAASPPSGIQPSNYGFSTLMSVSQHQASWGMPNHTPSFDDCGNTDYYSYSSPVSGNEQEGPFLQNFTNVPRTWNLPYEPRTMDDGDTSLDTYEPSVYLVDTNKQDENVPTTSSLAYGGQGSSQDLARLSISRSPKIENKMMDSTFPSLDDHGTFRMPSTDGSEDDGHTSREMTVVDPEDQSADEPYAKLIHRALMSAPNHSMVLQEIYQWFRENTSRGSSDTKGWMNSIRHNLSMNAAFKKTERKIPGDETKKSTEWVLEEFAVKDGVQSTTRYRKGTGNKKFTRSENPAPSRQSSGRKGGICAGKTKLQRQRVNDRSDSRRSSQRIDTGRRPQLQHHTRSQAKQRHIPPLTPTTDAMASSSPYSFAKPEQYNVAYDNLYNLEDVQGVLIDDTPLFTNTPDLRCGSVALVAANPIVQTARCLVNVPRHYQKTPPCQTYNFMSSEKSWWSAARSSSEKQSCYVKSNNNESDDIPDALHKCNKEGHAIFHEGSNYTVGTALDLTFLNHIDTVLIAVDGLHNSIISDLVLRYSPEYYLFVAKFTNIVEDDINIVGASKSANVGKTTDGWDTYRTLDIVIQNSRINNRDTFTSTSYTIHLTDLTHIWSESLDRRKIVGRSLEENTSIDPSEGGQLQILLDKIKYGLGEDNDTTLTLTVNADYGRPTIVLNLEVDLPGPLEPLKWPVYLAAASPLQLTCQLTLPLLKAQHAQNREIVSLIEALREKDYVIQKLADTVETFGIELNQVFPQAGGRTGRKVDRQKVEGKVKGMGLFDLEIWRKGLGNDEILDTAGLLGDLFAREDSSGNMIRANQPTLEVSDSWWEKIRGTTFTISDAKKLSSSKIKQESKLKKSNPKPVQEKDDFQVQATPPRAVDAKKEPIIDDSTDDDLNVPSQKPQLSIIPDSFTSSQPLPIPKKIGTISSKMAPQNPPSQPSQNNQESDTATDDEPHTHREQAPIKRNPSPISAPIPASPKKGKLGKIGGKKEPPPTPVSEPFPEHEVSSLPVKAAPKKGQLGRIGGKKKAPTPVPEPEPEAGPSTANDSSPAITPIKKRKLGTIGRKASPVMKEEGSQMAKEEEERGRKEITEEVIPAREETSLERADRKREALRKELEMKAKAPVKKKRKF